MLSAATCLLLAYLCGSLPIGVLIAKWVSGVDIRKHGSGNIGATNVARVIGKKWGTVVLLFDALKGLLPTLYLPMLFHWSGDAGTDHERVLCGLAAILGHMYPVWLKFRGGKGVATALGVVLIVSPWGTLVALVTFVVVFAWQRIVSLASIAAALAFGLSEAMFMSGSSFDLDRWSRSGFALIVVSLIVIRHRSNIGRLLIGEEETFGTPASPVEEPQDPDQLDPLP